MVYKADIEKAFKEQQGYFKRKETLVHREYLDRNDFEGSHIQIVSGVRRSGKSTMFLELFREKYPHAVVFNFEDPRVFGFDIHDFPKLYEIMGTGRPAYFFDEIQSVEAWEVFVRNMHDRGEKVFVTGSNASMLSKDLGTRLTGRYLQHELFPFSYGEFLEFTKMKPNAKSFSNYLEQGGFPEYLSQQKAEVHHRLFRDIVYRDIAIRHSVRNVQTLERLGLFLLSNIGKECSFNSLRKTLKIPSANTVLDYVRWYEDSYVLFLLPRFSWSPKSMEINPRKVYGIDTGFIRSNTLSFSKDVGRLLENAVFLHLHKNYRNVYYFKETGECDFVVFEDNQCKQILQVCSEMHDDNREREIDGLTEAMRFFGKESGTVITLNQKDELRIDGKMIRLIPVWEWIEQPKS